MHYDKPDRLLFGGQRKRTTEILKPGTVDKVTLKETATWRTGTRGSRL